MWDGDGKQQGHAGKVGEEYLIPLFLLKHPPRLLGEQLVDQACEAVRGIMSKARNVIQPGASNNNNNNNNNITTT